MRYFLDGDNEGRLYLVDASKKKEWDEYLDSLLDEEAEGGYNVPVFAVRMQCAAYQIEFEKPSWPK